MEKEFVIRSYGYCELAMLYFPNSTKKSASAQLGRWIKSDDKLSDCLKSNGLKTKQRILTPRQVEILVNYLGAP
jgi:hypothetical protein